MNKESYEITPEDLLKDLKWIFDIQNERLLILYLDLYIEHFIHAIYKKEYKKHLFFFKRFLIKKRKGPSFRVKINNLVKWGIIDKMYLESSILVYKLRCRLVHDLRPDIQLLTKWINEHEPPIEDNVGLIKKFLNKADPLVKIQLYACPTIIYLYRRSRELSGKKPEYNIIFKITPNAEQIQMELFQET